MDLASSPRPPLPPFFSLTITKWQYKKEKKAVETTHKQFSKGKQVHVRMELSKTNQTRWEWHHNIYAPSLHLVPFCLLCTPQNYALCIFICIEWTRYTQLCSLHSLTHKRQPISAMFSSNKISQHNLNSNIPHRPSIAQALHSFCMQSRQTICHAQYSNYNAAIHNITHSPCTSKCTTHPPLPTPLPSTTLLCIQLTNSKHICVSAWWQNSTMCRDGLKVFWCHSHLVWLVFEASIPSCTFFLTPNLNPSALVAIMNRLSP